MIENKLHGTFSEILKFWKAKRFSSDFLDPPSQPIPTLNLSNWNSKSPSLTISSGEISCGLLAEICENIGTDLVLVFM